MYTTDAPQNIQSAIDELNRRLRKLETATSNSVSSEQLDNSFEKLNADVRALARKPTTLDFNDVFRGGDAHALGYVPDPASGYGDGQHYLGTDGYWVPLLDGYVRLAAPGEGGRSLAQAVVEVHGSLAVTGAIQGENVRARNSQIIKDLAIGNTLTATGNTTVGGDLAVSGSVDAPQLITALTELTTSPDQDTDYLLINDASAAANKKILPKYISGNMPASFPYSSGQFFTTTGANLTSYDYTFPAGDLQVGDVVCIDFLAAQSGTTAGTRSLTLALGAGTPTTIFSTTTTTNGLVYKCYITIKFRTTTLINVTGWVGIGVSGAAFTTTYGINGNQTINSISANSQLLRFVGTHTGSNTELSTRDVYITVYRAGGNATVV